MSEVGLPIGWRRASLASLASYVNGFAFNDQFWSEKGLPIVRIAQITGSQPVVDRFDGQLPSQYRLDDGDLIFSWSGTLAVVRWNRAAGGGRGTVLCPSGRKRAARSGPWRDRSQPVHGRALAAYRVQGAAAGLS